jgi:hypothetical protein
VKFGNGNRDGEPGAGPKASRKGLPRVAGLAVITLLGFALPWQGLASPKDEPAKPKDVPAKPKDQPQGRRAKRPPAARIQTDLVRASQTNVEFRQPVEFAYKDFNELVVQAATFDVGNAGELGLPSKFELLCYNGLPVGPTIRVRRGTTFHIRVKNALPAAKEAAHTSDDTFEQPHELCTTNLHTHGLHVSPAGNADNIRPFRKLV